jgi:hypothetical protein
MKADVRTRDAAWILAQCVEEGECLLWPGAMGVGTNRANPIVKGILASGKANNLPVRRMVWEHRHGPVPAGKVVYRTCCQNRCLFHLEAGPPGAPIRQRKKAGLSAHSPSARAALTSGARGRANAVNTPAQEHEVKRLVSEGLSNIEIFRLTGVSAAMVCKIRSGKCWATTVQGSSVFALASR